ncbi:MAG: adenylosuccinate lyase, partial [Bombilactobacillus sp.]|nr:adenylosuccinate lyase [Bombilactobacillus sp.]
KLTTRSWNEGISFRKLVEDSQIMNYLSKDDVADAFDYHYHLRHVDEIFKKVGLE